MKPVEILNDLLAEGWLDEQDKNLLDINIQFANHDLPVVKAMGEDGLKSLLETVNYKVGIKKLLGIKPELQVRCTCDEFSKQRALCPVCDKEEYERMKIQSEQMKRPMVKAPSQEEILERLHDLQFARTEDLLAHLKENYILKKK